MVSGGKDHAHNWLVGRGGTKQNGQCSRSIASNSSGALCAGVDDKDQAWPGNLIGSNN